MFPHYYHQLSVTRAKPAAAIQSLYRKQTRLDNTCARRTNLIEDQVTDDFSAFCFHIAVTHMQQQEIYMREERAFMLLSPVIIF